MIQKHKILIQDGVLGLPKLPPAKALFTLIDVPPPSWNEIIYLSPYKRKDFIRHERSRGATIGLEIGRALGIQETLLKSKDKLSLRGMFRPVLVNYISRRPLFCVCFIWREPMDKDPAKPRYKRDVYNASLKGLIDGFTDTGLWADDSEVFHNDVWISYRGLSHNPRMELTFFEILSQGENFL